ncbi:hypothetical protein TIFTF001_014023 [Ficus carica]|uniref:Uncharacterized protein n=1 Tax=Ficus carica TaxID=3494 RepID=A0AA88D3M9_FICCA|nr:hypothetical protein TIFTF001_014023 [Ficus carica]
MKKRPPPLSPLSTPSPWPPPPLLSSSSSRLRNLVPISAVAAENGGASNGSVSYSVSSSATREVGELVIWW